MVLVSLFTLTASCSDDNDKSDAEVLKSEISSYNEFGAAMLDFTEADMMNAGFTLGDVILCPLKADPTADDYNSRLIEALKQLPSHPAPYVVHCMEGKDRTGYVCALLEGLCGATYDEMVADYLVTYDNYYRINPTNDSNLCNTLVSLRLNTCLMYYANVSDEAQLPEIDYAKTFARYLLAHGMSQQQLDALIQALTGAI